MREVEENWCECEGHLSEDFSKLTDYYCRHFVPTGWRLEYTTLSEPEPGRMLYLIGKCEQCGGFIRCGVSVAGNFTHEMLLSDIYKTMLHHRPYDGQDIYGLYHGGCSRRSEWYWEQDQLTRTERVEQFTALFLEKDRQAARRWAEENMPVPPPRRETTTEFFNAVVEQVRSNGFWPEQSTFITCEPARPSWPPDTALCHPRFTFRPALTAEDSGGLQIDCYLDGIFNHSGSDKLVIGTIKTACTDRDTCILMGALTGALTYYGKAHHDANLDRYIPYQGN